jgi:YD repeat-containing protein
MEEIWYTRDAVPVKIDVNGKTQLLNNLSSRVETTTDEKGLSTRVEYDEWENPVKIIYPDASAVAYEYENTFNQVRKITDQKGTVTTFEYDNKGNLIKTVKAAGAAGEQIITCSYDAQGQLICARPKSHRNFSQNKPV